MYFLKRILLMVPMLLVISFLAFMLVRVAPGGPFDRERAPASPEVERQLRAKYHLDEPLLKQYFRYLGGVVQGDFGPSLKQRNHTVNDVIAQALPVSLLIGVTSFAFALGLGIPLGFLAAIKKGQWQDWIGSFLAISFVCVPALVVGPVLILFFAIRQPWFPVAPRRGSPAPRSAYNRGSASCLP